MSNSLKQDVINAIGKDRYIQSCKEIAQMYDDAERGICSNMQINTTEELSLYNVQFDILKSNKIYTKFVVATDAGDAKHIVMKKYRNLNIIEESIFVERIDIKRGMIFNG